MRRIRLFALVVAVSAAILPAVSARAGDPITLYGSGWGHGLGLSQWGAYGLANDGWTSTQILTHFYSGTKVSKIAQPPRDIRVALATAEPALHLTAEAGPVRLSVKRPVGGTLVGKIPDGQTWVVRSVDGAYEVHDADGAVVGGTTWGGKSSNLYATYADHGARVTVPEGGATYNRGTLEFNLTACANGCSLRSILRLPFEDYLLGIGEVPSSWPKEALRAQAVAARSFALYKIRKYGLQPTCNCHLTDGSNDQVYIGWDKEGGLDGHRWVKAVRSTAGSVVTYKGAVALTVFTASDGGHTEDLNVQWGTPLAAYPYLAGVCDPGDYTAANPWTDWSRQFTAGALTTALAPYTGDIGKVSGFGKIDRGVSGRIEDAVVRGGQGSASVSGTEIRSALALPDDRVWINADKNVVGAIRSKYDDLMCEPGLPTSIVKTLPGGARQTFQSGAIYRNAELDLAIWLKGPIYEEYLAAGGASGDTGSPGRGPAQPRETRQRRLPRRLLPRRLRARAHLLEGRGRRVRPVGQRARVLHIPGRRRRRAGVPDVARADAGRRFERRRRSNTGRSRARAAGTARRPEGLAALAELAFGGVARTQERVDESVRDGCGLRRRDCRRTRLELVPRGECDRGAVRQWPVRRQDRVVAVVRDRGQSVDHILRQRGVARLPVVHDHRAVLHVVDGVGLADRRRVDPRRDGERGRVVVSGRRGMVGIRRALPGLQMQAPGRARRGRLHIPASGRLRCARSRLATRAAGSRRAGRTTRCRRRSHRRRRTS